MVFEVTVIIVLYIKIMYNMFLLVPVSVLVTLITGCAICLQSITYILYHLLKTTTIENVSWHIRIRRATLGFLDTEKQFLLTLMITKNRNAMYELNK